MWVPSVRHGLSLTLSTLTTTDPLLSGSPVVVTVGGDVNPGDVESRVVDPEEGRTEGGSELDRGEFSDYPSRGTKKFRKFP